MMFPHKDLQTAVTTLQAQGYTCVLCREGQIHTATERGVKPLVRWLAEGTPLRDFWAADKVVGKATAYLYVLLGVRGVHAQVMSRSAQQVLTRHGIDALWDTIVENIINRRGDGICPFEAAVLDIQDPEDAYRAIREKMVQMHITL